MASISYRDEGFDGRAYTIVEYQNAMAVYVFKGYIRGNVFHLYPFKSLVKGERRDKKIIGISEVRK